MEKLTQREREVLTCLVKGYRNHEIAAQLSMSFHTVKAHLNSIYRKFGVENRVQATCKAMQHADLLLDL